MATSASSSLVTPSASATRSRLRSVSSLRKWSVKAAWLIGLAYTGRAGHALNLPSRPRPAPQRPAEPFALDAFHHLLHLLVLLEEAVDLGDGGAGAHGDAALAAAVQDVRPVALVGGHRVDDRFDLAQASFVDARGVEPLERADFRQHLHDRGEGAEAADLAELVAQVFQGELVLDHALGEALRLFGVEAALGLLDQRQDVAHADHARGHALGVEELQVVVLFADADEADRHARHGADREGRAAAGVAVELGEDGAGQRQGGGELLGALHRVLAGHRVGHEQGLVRLDPVGEAADLVHQRLVDMEAAGGVHDHHVVSALAGDGEGALAESDHGLSRVRLQHRHVDAAADLLELLDGGGALQVAGDEKRVLAALLEALGQLARGGRLARALEAAEHDDRRAAVEAELGPLLAEEGGELVADDLHDLLRRGEALHHLLPEGALADPVDERLDHPEVHVGFEKSQTDLAQRRVERFGGDLAFALQAAEDVLELVLETVEHGQRPRLIGFWGTGRPCPAGPPGRQMVPRATGLARRLDLARCLGSARRPAWTGNRRTAAGSVLPQWTRW